MGDGVSWLLAQEMAEAIPGQPGPAPQSTLAWYVATLGLYGPILFVAGLAVFVGACYAIARTRTTADLAIFAVFLPLPLLIGASGTIEGLIESFSVIAYADHAPKWTELAEGYATSLVTAKFSVMVTLPPFLLLFWNWFVRPSRLNVE